MITPFADPIYVTRPLLPPLEAVTARLAEVWEAQWLTNDGHQHVRLAQAISAYLAVPHVSLFNNGTIALLAAVRALVDLFNFGQPALLSPPPLPAAVVESARARWTDSLSGGSLRDRRLRHDASRTAVHACRGDSARALALDSAAS